MGLFTAWATIQNFGKLIWGDIVYLESCGVLEFLNTLESKLNIVTMSPSSDTRIPSDGELGRKWLYLKKDKTSYGFEPTILQQESFYFSAGWT